MDVAKAKFFVYHGFKDENVIYVSRDIQTLIDKQDAIIPIINAVVETESGEIMFDMDTTYSGEPIITRRFMHYETYKQFHPSCKIIEL